MTPKIKSASAADSFKPESPAAVIRPRISQPALELMQHDAAGMLICTAEKPMEANPAALSLHGFSAEAGPDALVAVTNHYLASSELRVLVQAESQATMRDYRWQRDDRTEVWIRAFSAPVLWEGRPARQIWLLDVTAEQQRDAEVRRSHDRMAEAQRFTHIGNWEWNLQTGTCLWSEELYRIYGQRPGSFVPTPHGERWVHAGDIDRVRETLQGCIESRRPATFEYRVLRPGGEERVLEVHVDLTLGDAGEVIALSGAANDVTRDKVIQRQIEDEKSKAERASNAKSEFMANMSHELRTPLNAIIGFSEVMRRELFGSLGDGRYKDYAASIHESGNHLLRLINDILDLSKVEAGKYRLREEIVDVTQVIDHCLKSFSVTLEKKALSLVRSVPDDLPQLLADKRVLQQILLNLLSNAVKFTDQGSVTMDAACDGDLVIRIHDTGVGMAAKDITRAFEPFEQIESSAALSHEGTGIGLPLTKQLVEAHGGRLHLTSKPGIGTTVEARFPQARVIR